ncbi:MAG: HNH endonuclease signature motif containing protein [Gemmatimonadaceae bacterium]|jgi:hypothetical protein
MGKNAAALMGKGQPPKGGDGQHDAKGSPEDDADLKALQDDAAARGCVLASGGEGGLPADVVREVMERDEFTCKRCGETGTEENGGLTVHHQGHLENPSPEMARKYARLPHDDPDGMVTLCARDHDKIHNLDREGKQPGPIPTGNAAAFMSGQKRGTP